MNLTRYLTYKSQGVPWIDEYPANWSSPPLYALAKIRNGEGITSESIEPAGQYPVYGGNGLRGFATDFTHEGPRVLVGRQGALAGNVHRVKGKYWVSEHAIVFDPDRGVSVDWLFYALGTMNLGQYSQAAAQPGIAAEVVRRLRVPFPSLDEQAAIAKFLDRETAKIDALIAKQEQLIATLQEDRIATITHAVTQGMDSSVSVGGQSWPGDVPRHWVIGKVKYYFEVVLGKMYQGERKRPGDTLLPHLKAGSLTSEGLVTEDPMLCWFSPTEVVELDLRRGDVLVVEGGSIGRCVVLEQDLSGWGFQKSLNRVRSLGGDLPEFLAYVIEAATASGYVSLLCGKATIPHFTAEKLGAMEFPRPPIDEQRTIVSFLVEREVRIRSLTQQARKVVDRLREYRSTLITDAVTGKIDVREMV